MGKLLFIQFTILHSSFRSTDPLF